MNRVFVAWATVFGVALSIDASVAQLAAGPPSAPSNVVMTGQTAGSIHDYFVDNVRFTVQ